MNRKLNSSQREEYRKVVLDGIYTRKNAEELMEKAIKMGLHAHTELHEKEE